MQLINTRIVKYEFKEIVCLIKGDRLAPSFNPETMHQYLEDLKEGIVPKELPMGAYEYDCCVEYLKKLRRMLYALRKDFQFITLEFDDVDTCQTVIPPLEDCLEMVCKEVGFKMIEENFMETGSYFYTFQSNFWRD